VLFFVYLVISKFLMRMNQIIIVDKPGCGAGESRQTEAEMKGFNKAIQRTTTLRFTHVQ